MPTHSRTRPGLWLESLESRYLPSASPLPELAWSANDSDSHAASISKSPVNAARVTTTVIDRGVDSTHQDFSRHISFHQAESAAFWRGNLNETGEVRLTLAGGVPQAEVDLLFARAGNFRAVMGERIISSQAPPVAGFQVQMPAWMAHAPTVIPEWNAFQPATPLPWAPESSPAALADIVFTSPGLFGPKPEGSLLLDEPHATPETLDELFSDEVWLP